MTESFCGSYDNCGSGWSLLDVTAPVTDYLAVDWGIVRIVTTGCRRRSDDAIGAADWRRNTKPTSPFQRLCTGRVGLHM